MSHCSEQGVCFTHLYIHSAGTKPSLYLHAFSSSKGHPSIILHFLSLYYLSESLPLPTVMYLFRVHLNQQDIRTGPLPFLFTVISSVPRTLQNRCSVHIFQPINVFRMNGLPQYCSRCKQHCENSVKKSILSNEGSGKVSWSRALKG